MQGFLLTLHKNLAIFTGDFCLCIYEKAVEYCLFTNFKQEHV